MITPLQPYAAALVKTPKKRTMIIADLHLGWEMALSQQGIHVPSQMPKLLSRLKTLLSAYKPERLLILGDVKYTVATADMGEWHDIPDFFNELKKEVKEISIIRGNHDGNIEPLLPENIEILPATGTIVGDVGFFHGHKWPSPTILTCKTLVMGHVHPVVVLRDPAGFRITKQVWVKAECNRVQLTKTILQKHRINIKNDAEEELRKRCGVRSRVSHIFIMPSFNDFLGGRPLNYRRTSRYAKTEKILGPVIRSESVNMESAEIYLLDGTFLGTLKQLRSLS
jgi:putative SbcD/Mre11-related phosphoesterase